MPTKNNNIVEVIIRNSIISHYEVLLRQVKENYCLFHNWDLFQRTADRLPGLGRRRPL